jgi:hypothetical protein
MGLTRLAPIALSLALASGCAQDGSAPSSQPSPSPAAPSLAAPAARKGVGAWSFPGEAKAMADVGVAWFYTWRVEHQWEPAPAGVEFVPMVWDESHANATEIGQAVATGASALLGYNEPDVVQQANMTVDQALDLWPLLEGTGLRLGSPATAGDPSLAGSWLEHFMDGAATRGRRVDFVCVHWYGAGVDAAAEAADLERLLRAVYQKYQRPIWLTEFALVRWTPRVAFPAPGAEAEFVRKAVPILEGLPFLERYAWFALPPWSSSGMPATTNLYDDSGTPTAVGQAYRSLPAASR